MTQAETILSLLRESPKTLRQIAMHPSGVFYEFRSRVSELRAAGYIITHHRAKRCAACEPALSGVRCPAMVRGENCYRLEREPPTVESSGQQVMAWA